MTPQAPPGGTRRSLPEVLPAGATDLAEAIDQATALWRGIATVTAHVAPPIPALAPTRIADVCLLIEEGVANAMRHGSATTVEILLTPLGGDAIAITITDDGTGPTGGSPGLGSTIFDQASTAPWTLTARADGSGSVLYVVVAAASPVAHAAS